MSPVNKRPIERRVVIQDSYQTVISVSSYTTSGESFLVIKDVEECKLTLNSLTTKHIKIKCLSDTIIIPDYLVDGEYDELFLSSGSAIELVYLDKNWYVMSSDGLRNS